MKLFFFNLNLNFGESGKLWVAFVMDPNYDRNKDFWEMASKWYQTARTRTLECSDVMMKLFNDKKINLDQFGKLSHEAITILKVIQMTTNARQASKEQVADRLAEILSHLENLKKELQSLEAEPQAQANDDKGWPSKDPRPSSAGYQTERKVRKILLLLSNNLVKQNKVNMDKEKLMSPDDYLDNCDLISKARLRLERLQEELDLELDDWVLNQLKNLSGEMLVINEKLQV